jgi:VCBS repeat-containing protein
LKVLNTNDAPVAVNDSVAAARNVPLTLSAASLLANDGDPDPTADVLTVSAVGNASNGSVVLQGNQIVFMPDQDYSGPASFTYTVSDGHGGTASASVNIDVREGQSAPVTQDDTVSVQEDGTVSAAGNVLANDSDADAGTTLAVAAPGTFAGVYGTLTLAADGSYSYALNNDSAAVQSLRAGQAVTDSFGYAATDGTTATPGQLIVSIIGSNDAPVVTADAAGVIEDGATTASGNLLFNDSDADAGTVLTVAGPGSFAGVYGTLTLATNGNYSYALNNGAASVQALRNGQVVTDTFSYAATDGTASTPSQLIVSISGSNDAPVVIADVAAVSEDGVTTTSGNVLVNDSDVDAGTVLTVAAPGTYAGAYGTLTLAADGSYSYALNNGSVAVQSLADGAVVTDTFSYVATDGTASTPSQLTINITGSNDAPVVAADVAAVSEDGAVTASGNVLANDSDADAGTMLTIAAPGTFAGAHGTLTLSADGSYNYVLNNPATQSLSEGTVVTDTFSYAATDGTVATPTQLTISITGSNDAPVVVADVAAVSEDGAVMASGNVLANDSDVDDGTVLTVAAPGAFAGGYGTLTLAADGRYNYVLDSAAAQFLGEGMVVADTFSYVATDGTASTPSQLTISITGSNDAPVVAADVAAVSEDGAVTASGNVLANDSDVDTGTTLTVAAPGAFAGAYGTLTLATDGSYSYVLNNGSAAVQSLADGAVVTDTFSCAATDGTAATPSQLTINITGSNDAPVTVEDVASVQEDGALTATGNVLSNDSDVDAGTRLAVAAPGIYIGEFGSLTLGADGSYSYVLDNGSEAVQSLAAGGNVTDTFVYAATDGIAETTARLVVNIAGANDAPVALADSTEVSEDGVVSASGNVLANDSDVDDGTLLRVATPGTYAGAYGALTLAADGTYSYMLSNDSAAVQSLAAGQTVTDSFTYTATDGIDSVGTSLTVSIAGKNDAPVLINPIADQTVDQNAAFAYQVPLNAFKDIDNGDVLSYSATLPDGSALPGWLSFNAATRTFAGTPGTNVAGSLSLRVTATDLAGASASDTFVLTINATECQGKTIIGTRYDDKLTGTSCDDVIDGKGGHDVMNGGKGDDVYYVDGQGCVVDEVVEKAGEGYDTVYSSVSYTLAANVEELHLLGTACIDGTGNGLSNKIYGNRGDNTLTGGTGNDFLHGGAGADTLVGGSGDDTYVVDSECDDVVECTNAGTDLVLSSVDYTLGDYVENLTLTGTCAINGTGNALNNVIIGNAANNTLAGGAGADTMTGGAGNDVYVVDNSGDMVAENSNEGIDQVKSSITHTLGSNVEALMLTGSAAINGTGNAGDNLVQGNSGKNTLKGGSGMDILQGGGGVDTLTDTVGNNLLDGGAGNDIITGGAGNDFIVGGTGNDTVVTGIGADVIAFNRGDGQDTIVASTGKDNTLSLGKGIKYADLSFKKSNNDLILVTGSNEQVTFKDWYASADNSSVDTLQIVIEGTSDYSASSTNKLKNRKIEQFDFDGLVSKFDQARAANPALTTWGLSSSLLNFHLGGSNTAAIGGDLAYQHARNGNLSSVSMTPAQALLASSQFGTANQALQGTSALQDLSPRLM